MKEHLNARVKHREWYRPFAPSVLVEEASKWFDIAQPSPFMLYIAQCSQPEELPAIVHVDGSSRLQTVNRDDAPEFHSLITHFQALTGVPVLLNTSLNVNDEPLVETPEDAIRFFQKGTADLLVIGDRMLKKEP
jgi:carbamoyltransferase